MKGHRRQHPLGADPILLQRRPHALRRCRPIRGDFAPTEAGHRLSDILAAGGSCAGRDYVIGTAYVPFEVPQTGLARRASYFEHGGCVAGPSLP